jgi:hypothetical protein
MCSQISDENNSHSEPHVRPLFPILRLPALVTFES